MRRPVFIAQQSRCPSGPLGWLLGHIMAVETAAENDATMECLALRPDDRVLEIGFGPGRALERVAACLTAGSIAGVDSSDAMVRSAARRCARFVADGRVRLVRGSAECLPFASADFDKVYSVHTLYFWRDPAVVAGEVRRVLKRGGTFTLCFRPRDDAGAASFPPEVYRFYGDDEVAGLLRENGFDDVVLGAARPSSVLRIARGRAA